MSIIFFKLDTTEERIIQWLEQQNFSDFIKKFYEIALTSDYRFSHSGCISRSM